MKNVARKLLKKTTFLNCRHFKMNTQSQKDSFLVDHLTDLLHKIHQSSHWLHRTLMHIKINAFRREDESNQQLLRLYKIERTSIFDRILIGTIYLRKGNGIDCVLNFSK